MLGIDEVALVSRFPTPPPRLLSASDELGLVNEKLTRLNKVIDAILEQLESADAAIPRVDPDNRFAEVQPEYTGLQKLYGNTYEQIEMLDHYYAQMLRRTTIPGEMTNGEMLPYTGFIEEVNQMERTLLVVIDDFNSDLPRVASGHYQISAEEQELQAARRASPESPSYSIGVPGVVYRDVEGESDSVNQRRVDQLRSAVQQVVAESPVDFNDLLKNLPVVFTSESSMPSSVGAFNYLEDDVGYVVYQGNPNLDYSLDRSGKELVIEFVANEFWDLLGASREVRGHPAYQASEVSLVSLVSTTEYQLLGILFDETVTNRTSGEVILDADTYARLFAFKAPAYLSSLYWQPDLTPTQTAELDHLTALATEDRFKSFEELKASAARYFSYGYLG